MFRKTKTFAVAAASAALFLGAAGASLASAAPSTPTPGTHAREATTPKPEAGIFQVGTSVVDITPHKPMPDGGYGSNYIVTGGAHDPLQVRAFFIGHGKHAVAFVSVDSQGWFAAYQAPNVGDGADNARADAAAALAARGYEVNASNIVLSATHSHAAPTMMGIWGHTDPAYLRKVRKAAVKAVIKAAVRHPRSRTVVGDGHDPRPRLAAAGDRPDGRLLGRPAAADPVGAPARHRCDDRHLRRRAGARRRIRPDRGRQQPVERRLPRVCPESPRVSCSAAPL